MEGGCSRVVFRRTARKPASPIAAESILLRDHCVSFRRSGDETLRKLHQRRSDSQRTKPALLRISLTDSARRAARPRSRRRPRRFVASRGSSRRPGGASRDRSVVRRAMRSRGTKAERRPMCGTRSGTPVPRRSAVDGGAAPRSARQARRESSPALLRFMASRLFIGERSGCAGRRVGVATPRSPLGKRSALPMANAPEAPRSPGRYPQCAETSLWINRLSSIRHGRAPPLPATGTSRLSARSNSAPGERLVVVYVVAVPTGQVLR